MHYNCRWSDSGVRWVDGMKTLKDVDTGEYVTPHLHPPWLVKMNHERKLGLRPPHSQDIAWAAGKQPPKSVVTESSCNPLLRREAFHSENS